MDLVRTRGIARERGDRKAEQSYHSPSTNQHDSSTINHLQELSCWTHTQIQSRSSTARLLRLELGTHTFTGYYPRTHLFAHIERFWKLTNCRCFFFWHSPTTRFGDQGTRCVHLSHLHHVENEFHLLPTVNLYRRYQRQIIRFSCNIYAPEIDQQDELTPTRKALLVSIGVLKREHNLHRKDEVNIGV